MAPNAPFSGRIRARLQAAELGRVGKLRNSEAAMHTWRGTREYLHRRAESLYRDAVLPLLLCLPEHFPNAEVRTAETRGGLSGAVRFDPTERFPAATSLMLGVRGEPSGRGLVVEYRLEIIPALLEYQAEDELRLGFEELGRPDIVSAWVQLRLLRFLDTYLMLETDSYYQARNARADPVCGTHLWTTTAACRLEYAGRTLHFCSTACRDRFQADPERYLG